MKLKYRDQNGKKSQNLGTKSAFTPILFCFGKTHYRSFFKKIFVCIFKLFNLLEINM